MAANGKNSGVVNTIKCVVWDLDETLWDGTLLEGDEVALKPGIKDIIQALDSRGILQSIASKNNHDDAMALLKEFGIEEYFLFPEINWNPKSASLDKIQQSLNIQMDTFLFIDDQAFERDEVFSAHPSVTCLDASAYKTLLSDERLNPRFVTDDSKRRRQMYLEDMTRKREESSYKGPRKEFLASLNMQFVISHAREADLKRAEELTVRTNQLNATGKTYSYDQLKVLLYSPRHELLVCDMSDKYGHYGKVGLALVEVMENYYHLRLFLMSCRVMSLGVGTVLLSHIMQEAKRKGKTLRADFRHTGRNRVTYITFRLQHFQEMASHGGEDIVLENDLAVVHDFPPYIKVTVNKPRRR